MKPFKFHATMARHARAPTGTLSRDPSNRHDMDRWNDSLPSDLLDRICDRGDVQQFAKGEILFEEGDAPDGIYVLLDGKLKVYSEAPNGRELVFNVLEPGDVLGEMLLDGGLRSASVRAMTDVRCSIVDTAILRTLVRSEPDFAEYLIRKLIARVRRLSRNAKSLAIHSVHDRVITLLEEHAVAGELGREVPRFLTQQEIANRVGASREMVNHVVRDLVNEGYIHKDAAHRMTLLKKLPRRE